MKSFYTYKVLGAVLVTLLVINTIEAGQNWCKIKEKCSSIKLNKKGNKKIKHSENVKNSNPTCEYMDQPFRDSDEDELKRTRNIHGNGKGDEKEIENKTQEPNFNLHISISLGDDENIKVKEIRKSESSNGNDDKANVYKKRIFKMAEAVFDIKDRECPEGTEEEYKFTYDAKYRGPKILTYTLHEYEVDGEVKEHLKVERYGATEDDIIKIFNQHFAPGRSSKAYECPIIQEETHHCEPFDCIPLPRAFKLIVHDQESNGKVKRTLLLEEAGISICEASYLLHRYYNLGELQK